MAELLLTSLCEYLSGAHEVQSLTTLDQARRFGGLPHAEKGSSAACYNTKGMLACKHLQHHLHAGLEASNKQCIEHVQASHVASGWGELES